MELNRPLSDVIEYIYVQYLYIDIYKMSFMSISE